MYVRYKLERWRIVSDLGNGKVEIYRFGITKIVDVSEIKIIKN